MFSNMFNNALEHINFDAKTFSKKSALSVPVPARSNTPWGTKWSFLMVFENLDFAYLTVLFAHACLKLMHF